MAGRIRSLVQWLLGLIERQRVLGFLLVIAIWSCCAYQIFRRHHNTKFGNSINAERIRREAQTTRQLSGGTERQWDWRDMQRLPRLFINFQRITTCYYIYIILRNLAPQYFYALINWFQLPLAAHCYLVGRYIASDSIDRQITTMFAVYHIVWRLLMYIRDADYPSNLIIFLLMSDHDLKQYLALIESPGARTAEVTKSSIERLFSSTICYKRQLVHDNSIDFVLRLRPNRTAEVQRKLRRHIAEVVVCLVGIFIFMNVCVQLITVYQNLDMRHYLQRYPGCNRQPTTEMPAEWTLLEPTAHSLATMIIELVENYFIWTEAGYSAIAVWVCTYFLNYDLEIYSNKLTASLKRLRERVKLSNRLAAFTRQELKIACLTEPIARNKNLRKEAQELDEETHELLAQFYDFFRQIHQIDLFVSDVLTFSIFIWISLFAVLGHLYIERPNRSNQPGSIGLILFVEAFTYIVMTVGCLSLLKLQSKNSRNYKTICSIMAYQRGNQKVNLTRMLDFFIVTKRSAYTIFQQYPFTKTTYLSVIGWSFSFFFILDGLRRR